MNKISLEKSYLSVSFEASVRLPRNRNNKNALTFIKLNSLSFLLLHLRLFYYNIISVRSSILFSCFQMCFSSDFNVINKSIEIVFLSLTLLSLFCFKKCVSLFSLSNNCFILLLRWLKIILW